MAAGGPTATAKFRQALGDMMHKPSEYDSRLNFASFHDATLIGVIKNRNGLELMLEVEGGIAKIAISNPSFIYFTDWLSGNIVGRIDLVIDFSERPDWIDCVKGFISNDYSGYVDEEVMNKTVVLVIFCSYGAKGCIFFKSQEDVFMTKE